MARAKVPNPGRMWNPVKGYPRNAPCFCGSEIKFKKCCGPKVKPTCKAEDYMKYKAFVQWVEAGGVPLRKGFDDV